MENYYFLNVVNIICLSVHNDKTKFEKNDFLNEIMFKFIFLRHLSYMKFNRATFSTFIYLFRLLDQFMSWYKNMSGRDRLN